MLKICQRGKRNAQQQCLEYSLPNAAAMKHRGVWLAGRHKNGGENAPKHIPWPQTGPRAAAWMWTASLEASKGRSSALHCWKTQWQMPPDKAQNREISVADKFLLLSVSQVSFFRFISKCKGKKLIPIKNKSRACSESFLTGSWCCSKMK